MYISIYYALYSLYYVSILKRSTNQPFFQFYIFFKRMQYIFSVMF